jgi:ATP-dependent DNA helicase DinG
MHALHDRLKRVLKLPLLLQGELPKTELLQRFRSSGEAVLVATSSFWEGVDVAGFALRLVVLEKIPFLVPSDPLVRARSLLLEEQGRNPFTEYALPAAAIALKQGFGRLIRSSHDKGIVALLDERLHRRGYGQRLLAALPPAQRATRFEEVVRFWELAYQTAE